MNNNSYTDKLIAEYSLRIGDTSLILAQRLGEWCGHGPILEEDIALTNISLDLLGQARTFLTYSCEKEKKNRTEDDLAFLREAREFRNTLLAEQPNGNFAKTILRQLFISCYQFYFFDALKKSSDERLSALAEKSLKEVTYHLRHSSEWTLRLAGGTEISREKILNAQSELWKFTGDLFATDDVDLQLMKLNIAVDMNNIRLLWKKKMEEIFNETSIEFPADSYMITGGIKGIHTEYLGHLLSEMQILPRSYPGAKW